MSLPALFLAACGYPLETIPSRAGYLVGVVLQFDRSAFPIIYLQSGSSFALPEPILSV